MADRKKKGLPYRKCVGAVLFNQNGLVFVGERNDMGESSWQMPQGGVDKGEKPRKAVKRELAEEIGTDKIEIVAEHPDWLCYDFPKELIGTAWGGRFRGQKQKWFALRFTGADSDIDLSAGRHPEFRAWQWIPIGRLCKIIIPFKRPVYEAVVEEFRQLSVFERSNT
ncbi:MAG: RNA pyrophosphohydrolase [Rhodospirillales bacterium]|jgi:putative (di)nucleoside polyphosphate hydrolase|nr:RNA pyrophosphohydrolase [Rhodospirillales bacterium]